MTGTAKDSRPQTASGAVPAALPANEAQRLAPLHATEVLDSAPGQTYDDLTAPAAHICGTPIALVSLVHSDRQWFKSRAGLERRQFRQHQHRHRRGQTTGARRTGKLHGNGGSAPV